MPLEGPDQQRLKAAHGYICLAAARIFGWDGKPLAEVNVTNHVGVICTEEQRQRLIALRERLHPPRALPERTGTQPQAAVTDDPQEGNSAATNDVVPSGMPGATVWSAPAGARAPMGADPVYRAWLIRKVRRRIEVRA